MPSEKQNRERLEKLKVQRDKLDEQIEEIEDELPTSVVTRGDPVVRIY